MKTDTKHTQTPWLWREELDGSFVIETDMPLPEMVEIASGLTEGNAEFIVRAVHAHGELVAALTAIKARLTGEFDNPALMAYGPLSVGAEADIGSIAEAALAKAEGK